MSDGRDAEWWFCFFLIVRSQKYNKTHSRSIVNLFPIIIMKYHCSNMQYNIL